MLALSTACFYPAYTEQALKDICELGIKNVEFFFNAKDECSKKYIDNINDILRFYGASVLSTHTYTGAFEHYYLFSDYDRRRHEIKDDFHRMMEATRNLGASVLSFHGQRLSSSSGPEIPPTEIEAYADGIYPILELCEQYGVDLCQENVSWCKSYSPAFISLAKKALNHPHFKFTLDIKQADRVNIDPKDYIDAAKDILANVHLSDCDPVFSCLLPGRGNFDFTGLFSYLRDSGYKGNYVIEVYRSSFNERGELIKSYEDFWAAYGDLL